MKNAAKRHQSSGIFILMASVSLLLSALSGCGTRKGITLMNGAKSDYVICVTDLENPQFPYSGSGGRTPGKVYRDKP